MTHATPPLSPTIADIKALIHREARRVTSYDVAIAAGVSQSAVSRCFKPGASVSKATYARVMQAAAELAYTPNAAARSLNTRRSNLVALIAPDLLHQQSPELLAELSRQFSLRGMRLVLFSQPREAAPGSLSEVWEHQLDGAIVAASLSEPQLAEFERRALPFVLFNLSVRDKNVNAVLCDQVGAARTMVARLAAAGHKRFAMIDGPAGSAMAQQRRRGVAERLAELGLAPPLCVSGEHDYASGARGLREIVARLGHAPDAIICGNDAMAIGCLDTARHELGLAVPGQLSVTGFDGMAQAGWLSYNLTTLRQPVRQMAQATADMLAGLIGTGNAGCERRVFSASVVEGATARLGPTA
ncbi:LacI family DNA-binding transcriptional regulator [Massilia sp. R2A-15]|uniref:LacI family DNA-binding transcriptional regulator n=1 Tax=Massilia sp. R2A-15 TaxID=3064278 RepID=UPI0027357A18|nr:LacI family DNA-binding transcriptional regulator [Massilia sp. R2A-15]WLI91197.1 LacI family DNA-binding transcriptional regulator [Massilia sp. R2A-15]